MSRCTISLVDPLLAALIGAVLASAFGAVRYWRADPRRTRRVLRKARVVPIANLVDGQLACVVGRVERDSELIESLMERRLCVAFDTTTNVFDGADFTSPLTIRVTRRLVPFFVVDGTGRVRVDAAQAALCNKPIGKGQDFIERVIDEGATVRLVGSVILDPATSATGEHSFREGAWKATITGTTKFPLLIDVIED